MSQISLSKKILFMFAMIASYAIIFIDESGIAVILPRAQTALNLSDNAIHWIINIYLLILSVLLLFGGKLSDLYGHRRIFSLGIGIFSIASIICGLSSNEMTMIAGRILQGIGASLLMPCITVLVHKVFAEKFGKAFGFILSCSNLFYAIGPFIGGILTQYASWKWFFFINVPIGIICLIFTYVSVSKDAENSTSSFTDYTGLILLILILSAFISALMQGGEWGWTDIKFISLILFSIVGFIFFVKLEFNKNQPLLDLNLFKNKAFSAGNLILLCTTICLTISVFLALWLQKSLGLSPSLVGIALLPATIPFIFIPTIGGHWAERIGLRIPILTGCVLILIGMIWITVIAYKENFILLLPGLICFGIGIPLAIPNSISVIMSEIPAKQAGLASGILSTIRQFALSLGIAIFSAVLTTTQHNSTYTTGFIHAMIIMTLFAVIALFTTHIYIKRKI